MCASAGNCTAVGSYSTGSKMEGLLLSERGGRWGRGVEALLPAGGTQATYVVSDRDPSVYGVSCASAGNCSAIGVYEDGALHPHGMLLTETDGSWGRGIEARVP